MSFSRLRDVLQIIGILRKFTNHDLLKYCKQIIENDRDAFLKIMFKGMMYNNHMENWNETCYETCCAIKNDNDGNNDDNYDDNDGDNDYDMDSIYHDYDGNNDDTDYNDLPLNIHQYVATFLKYKDKCSLSLCSRNTYIGTFTNLEIHGFDEYYFEKYVDHLQYLEDEQRKISKQNLLYYITNDIGIRLSHFMGFITTDLLKLLKKTTFNKVSISSRLCAKLNEFLMEIPSNIHHLNLFIDGEQGPLADVEALVNILKSKDLKTLKVRGPDDEYIYEIFDQYIIKQVQYIGVTFHHSLLNSIHAIMHENDIRKERVEIYVDSPFINVKHGHGKCCIGNGVSLREIVWGLSPKHKLKALFLKLNNVFEHVMIIGENDSIGCDFGYKCHFKNCPIICESRLMLIEHVKTSHVVAVPARVCGWCGSHRKTKGNYNSHRKTCLFKPQ